MNNKIECHIERIKTSIKQHELFAQLWIARATTGETKTRIMSHGFSNGTPFTDDEKIKDALDTATNHIRSISEETEILIEQMNKLAESNRPEFDTLKQHVRETLRNRIDLNPSHYDGMQYMYDAIFGILE